MTDSRGFLEEGFWPDSEEGLYDELNRPFEEGYEIDNPLRPDTHSEDEAIEYHFGPEEGGPEPESEEDERASTWSTYRIMVQGNTLEDRCSVHWATNDDNDDGWAGGEDDCASASYDNFENVFEALRFTSGGSRVGYGGCVVNVFIDGHKVVTQSEDYQHYRPYCPWPRKEAQ